MTTALALLSLLGVAQAQDEAEQKLHFGFDAAAANLGGRAMYSVDKRAVELVGVRLNGALAFGWAEELDSSDVAAGFLATAQLVVVLGKRGATADGLHFEVGAGPGLGVFERIIFPWTGSAAMIVGRVTDGVGFRLGLTGAAPIVRSDVVGSVDIGVTVNF